MRKRFGAFHSDSIEEYISKSIKPEKHYHDLNLSKLNDSQLFADFKFDFKSNDKTQISTRDTSQEDLDELQDEISRYLKTVYIQYSGEKIGMVLKEHFELQQENIRPFEYAVQYQQVNQIEQITRYWIEDSSQKQLEEIIQVYKQSSNIFIYIDDDSNDQKFNKWIDQISLLRKMQKSFIYRICGQQNTQQVQNQNVNYLKYISINDIGKNIYLIQNQIFNS